MKNKTFFSIILFSILLANTSCKQDNNSQPTNNHAHLFVAFPEAKFDFQKVYCPVYFGLEQSEVNANYLFVEKMGFSRYVDKLPTNPNWQKLDADFKSKNLSTYSMKQQNLYNEVAAISILRNHALLAANNEKERIAFYTKVYVESNGNSAGLLYHCLNSLGDYISKEDKSKYIQAVTNRSAEVRGKFSKAVAMQSFMRRSDSVTDSISRANLQKLESLIANESDYSIKLNSMLK